MAPAASALQLLERLDAILCAEGEALRQLDFAGIDAARLEKEALEAPLHDALKRLAGVTLTAQQRDGLRALRHRVSERGQVNLRRLEATMGSVRELVATLTGTERPTYGKRAHGYAKLTPARAVLTTEIG